MIDYKLPFLGRVFLERGVVVLTFLGEVLYFVQFYTRKWNKSHREN